MTTFNEEKVARHLQQQLNAGVRHLDAHVIERLAGARRLALVQHAAAQKNAIQPNSHFSLIAVSPWARLALMVLALGVGIASTYYWRASTEVHENAAIDSALLADDVPPNAYIDPGFQKWLERTSRSSAL